MFVPTETKKIFVLKDINGNIIAVISDNLYKNKGDIIEAVYGLSDSKYVSIEVDEYEVHDTLFSAFM